jgi:pilus assembly protein Flp/PilA
MNEHSEHTHAPVRHVQMTSMPERARYDYQANAREECEMRQVIQKFFRDEAGLTTVEYAVAGGLIAAAVVVAFGLLGDEVLEVIQEITAALAAR